MLSKGLTFIPSVNDATTFEILSDYFVDKLHKRINPPTIHPDPDGFDLYKNKLNTVSTMPTKYASFEGTLEHMKIQLSLLPLPQTVKDNLSRRQREALHKLQRNKNIINKADKGSTIVIRNLTDYIEEGLTHLSDTFTTPQ